MENLTEKDVETVTEVVKIKAIKEKNTSPSYRYVTNNPYTGEVVVKLFKEGNVPKGVVFVETREGTPFREKYGQYVAYRWTSRMSEIKICAAYLMSEEGQRLFTDAKVVDETCITLGDIVSKTEKKERKVREKKTVEANPENMGRASGKTFKFFASEDTETVTEGEPTKVDLIEGFEKEVEHFANKRSAIMRAKELGLSSELVQKIDNTWQIVQG